jgi:hypothetical protein
LLIFPYTNKQTKQPYPASFGCSFLGIAALNRLVLI